MSKSVQVGYGIEKRDYDRGTHILTRMPWGCFVRGKAICPDGKARAVRLAITADTFFSIPASVMFRGKRVAGFVTFAEDGDERWVEFRVIFGRKNSGAFQGTVK